MDGRTDNPCLERVRMSLAPQALVWAPNGLLTLTPLPDGPLIASVSGSLDPGEAPERVGVPGSHELRSRAECTSLEESV